jgi:hypothetical protein
MPDAIARVLDVGNCDMDHARIYRLLVGGFDTAADRARHAAPVFAMATRQPAESEPPERLVRWSWLD